jgi:hypothetical protein
LGSFAQYRAAIKDTSRDELELAADLAGALPGGHQASIAATLRRGAHRLGPAGSDVLRLAAMLAAAPVPLTLIAATLQQADGLEEQAARQQATRGIAQAENVSLATQAGVGADPETAGEPTVEGGWVVHALVARTMRLSDPEPQRTQALRPAQLGSQQVMDAHQRLLGPEHLDTLGSMNNLAKTLYALGSWPAQVTCCSRWLLSVGGWSAPTTRPPARPRRT